MKKRRKPGRREPNGRLSRKPADVAVRQVETEADVKSVAIEARLRQGVPPKFVDVVPDAGRPNCGTCYGLMRLQGELDEDQWQTCLFYIERRTAYMRSIKAPEKGLDGPRTIRQGEVDPESYDRWVALARQNWLDVLAVVDELTLVTRSPIKAALDQFLVVGERVDHLIGDFRLGLNALHRRCIQAQKKAA